jgi:hypothetical protein
MSIEIINWILKIVWFCLICPFAIALVYLIVHRGDKK